MISIFMYVCMHVGIYLFIVLAFIITINKKQDKH